MNKSHRYANCCVEEISLRWFQLALERAWFSRDLRWRRNLLVFWLFVYWKSIVEDQILEVSSKGLSADSLPSRRSGAASSNYYLFCIGGDSGDFIDKLSRSELTQRWKCREGVLQDHGACLQTFYSFPLPPPPPPPLLSLFALAPTFALNVLRAPFTNTNTHKSKRKRLLRRLRLERYRISLTKHVKLAHCIIIATYPPISFINVDFSLWRRVKRRRTAY